MNLRASITLLGLALLVPRASAADEGCDARARTLARRLSRVPQHVQLVPAKLPVRLPRGHSDGQVKVPGLTVDVRDDVYRVQVVDGPLGDLEPLTQQLDAIKQVEQMTGAREAAPVYLRIDRDQAVKPLLPMMCKLAGRRALHLLLEDRTVAEPKPYTPPEPPARLEAVLGQLERLPGAVEKATALSNLLQQSIGKCEALTERLERLSEVPTRSRAAKMVEVVPEGLRACKCEDVDIDAFEAFLLRVLAPRTPPAYARCLRLQCGKGEAHVVRLSARATGQALAKALDSENPDGPVRLVIVP